VAYNYKGTEITHFPYSIEEENVKPIYKTFPGWKEDLTTIKESKDLPKTLKDYVAFIEEFVGAPVKIVSVGPDRNQTIKL
jgi:adenylosuccinate synthase